MRKKSRHQSQLFENLEARDYLSGALGSVTDYPGVTNPTAVVLGDFENRGRSDVAVAGVDPNTSLSTVAIYLSNGDGTFGSPTYNDFPGTPAKFDLTVTGQSNSANVNLAVVDPVDAQAFVFIGNPDGTFATPIATAYGTPQAANTNPVAHVVSADINFDGEPDLLISDPADQQIVTLLSNGDGTYTQGTPITGTSTPFLPQNLLSIDLNGDGFADLAYSDGVDNHIFVATGDGMGNFAAPSSFLVAGTVKGIAAADLNHDSLPDLAVTTSAGGATDIVDVLLNSGGGAFAAATPLNTTLQNPGPVVIGDFNGDGTLDIATMNSIGLLDYFQGIGDGTFAAAVQTQPTTAAPTGLATADFNGDVKSDLLFTEVNSSLAGGGGFGVTLATTPPSLTPTIKGAISAKGGIAGQKIKLAQTVILQNTSPSTIVHSAVIQLDLSADTVFDSGDELLTSVTKVFVIKPGKSKSVRVTAKMLPAGLAAGNYFIVAQVTDSNTGVSTASSAGQITVIAPTIVLAGKFKRTPSTGNVNQQLNDVVITISNSGNVAAVGSLPIQVDGFDGETSTPFGTLQGNIKIKPGKSTSFHLGGIIPTAAGEFNLFVTLDPDNTLGETDTSNNLFSTAFPITVT